jgi:HAE1 family hydrophobic/amphiphilic exporter-1
MTVMVTIAALAPVAFFPKMGTDAYQPLATAVIGGLLMGTILTLVDIPIMHTLVDDMIKNFSRFKTRFPNKES